MRSAEKRMSRAGGRGDRVVAVACGKSVHMRDVQIEMERDVHG